MHRLFQVKAAPSVIGGGRLGPKLRWLCDLVREIQAKGERVVVFANGMRCKTPS